jgi:hypothetical protein
MMKRFFNIIFIALTGALLFASCKKDEHKNYLEGNDPIVLTSSEAGPFVLDVNQRNATATVLSWNNPNFRFTTGVSSQDVNYSIQISVAGTNFAPESTSEIAVPKELSKNLTVGQLNLALLNIGLVENEVGQADIRLKASLAGNADPVYSNVLNFTVTPFLDVVYPVPDALYITGAATPANWQCGCGEPENLDQKFTKVTSSRFEITIQLNANSSYLFIPVYGSWAAKYGTTGANNTNDPTGGDFKPNGGDMISPATSGSYKIVVEFKTGKFTVTPA